MFREQNEDGTTHKDDVDFAYELSHEEHDDSEDEKEERVEVDESLLSVFPVNISADSTIICEIMDTIHDSYSDTTVNESMKIPNDNVPLVVIPPIPLATDDDIQNEVN